MVDRGFLVQDSFGFMESADFFCPQQLEVQNALSDGSFTDLNELVCQIASLKLPSSSLEQAADSEDSAEDENESD